MGLAALFLTGCEMSVANLTPAKVPQNPSNTYMLSMNARIHDGSIIKKTVTPYVVIDGKVHMMQKSEVGASTYDFDYAIPEGRSEARYYYVVTYQVDVHGKPRDREYTTELYDLNIVNRYILSMDGSRGPAGARIGIMGRGFTSDDKVIIGGYETDTTFGSSHSLTFTVPALPAHRNYAVQVKSGNDLIPVGDFRIDGAELHVNQTKIQVPVGERTLLVVKTDVDAPAGGIPINVTTDIPDSVIMPEATIAEGTRSVSIPIEGASNGNGHLYIEAPGFKEISIPTYVVSSAARDSNEETAIY